MTYIQHPALGSFTIEIDGTAMQTINSAAADTTLSAKTSTTSPNHTLRIVPVSGPAAIDAFAVELSLSLLPPFLRR